MESTLVQHPKYPRHLQHPKRAGEQPDYDVAIVGYGPVGATLANLLAADGLKVAVFERDKDIFALPRAVQFDGECMRIFQTVGIADALREQLFIGPGMKFVNARGELLIDWPRPTDIGVHGWHPSYKFHQPQLEQMLRERLARYPNAHVHLRHDVFALDECAGCDEHDERDAHDVCDAHDAHDERAGRDEHDARDALDARDTHDAHNEHDDERDARDTHDARAGLVALRYEDMVHGRLRRATARYVVGCDGARSTVRRFMGVELADLKSHERWVVVDVLLDGERPDLGDFSIQYCDPQRPLTYTRGPANRRRWEIMVMPGDDERDLTRPEWIWARLARWVTPANAQLERSAIYTFHSVIAQGWRRGRLLIAGDAAHQTPPFMGQGMAAGVRDAANLAWKLSGVVRARFADSLLDTYERERSPHAREFIETAVWLGSVIQETDASQVQTRDADMTAAIRQFRTPQPRLGPGFHLDADLGPEIAQVAPQPRLADGRLLDEHVGHRFALVVTPAWAGLARDAVQAAGVDDVVVVAENATAAWLAALSAQAVLVRPDRYVYGSARTIDELGALLAHL